ncbi:hypothetical protein C0J45_7708 [Silurus meridionalis]|nr:hypothetical protein C0J45_7708 [Silurus meridionalis]
MWKPDDNPLTNEAERDKGQHKKVKLLFLDQTHLKMFAPGVCLDILKERQESNGLGTLKNPEKFLDQDYELLHQYFLIRRKTYIDDMFPPDNSSIGENLLEPEYLAKVEWMRPTQLVSNPYLIVDGVSRFDFAQGAVGNCWFLAAVGALTFHEPILQKIFPIGQVCGSYEDMKFGWVSEALKDFTGGVHMTLFPKYENTKILWDLMHRAAIANSLMGCGTPGNAVSNVKQDNGLVAGHAYTITGVTMVTSNGNQVQLVRLFNPWGNTEWNGNWSDRSQTWMTISEEERKKYTNVVEDGEFWMSMEDFCKCYCQLDICNYSGAFLDGSSESHWNLVMHEGRWLAGSSAGGCMAYKDTFWSNPQFLVKITDINKACEPATSQGPNMLVSLMQIPDQRNRRLTRNLPLGFSIFKANSRRGSIASYSNLVHATKDSKSLFNPREITDYVKLDPGEYVIVPYTSRPNKTASFILGFCSKTETHTGEHFTTLDSDGKVMRQISEHVTIPFKILFVFFFKYQEMNAEQLQRFLNENYIGGGVQSTGGFSLDVCQSIVAMMDNSVTGTLSAEEINNLLKRINLYKEIFFREDTNRDGILSLIELQHAVEAIGLRIGDILLKLINLRFADSTGRITLERFIFLALRLDCMTEIFKKLAARQYMLLKEHEVCPFNESVLIFMNDFEVKFPTL